MVACGVEGVGVGGWIAEGADQEEAGGGCSDCGGDGHECGVLWMWMWFGRRRRRCFQRVVASGRSLAGFFAERFSRH